MREIKSHDTHTGWHFGLASKGMRSAIKSALSSEYSVSEVDIDLAPLKLLTNPKNTFAFRARLNYRFDPGSREILGTATVDTAVVQSQVGDEYASSYAIVCITD